MINSSCQGRMCSTADVLALPRLLEADSTSSIIDFYIGGQMLS